MPKPRQKKLKIRVEKKRTEIVASKALRFNRSALDATTKKKLLLMQLAVAGFMIIFFTAWLFSLKYQFKAKANNNSQSSFDWEQTKTELDKAMNQVKRGIQEIKQIQATTPPANTLPRQPELTAEQINLLKGKLMNEAASSTATSAKK